MKKAFTFLECLVVAMFIAILLAIFVPIFMAAKHKADGHSCQPAVTHTQRQ
jgi:competence protein ComGC